MIPLSTIKLLRAWASWGQGQSLTYPSMSPMFGERALKTPLYGVGHTPDGVAEMEMAVCRLTYDDRYLIIQKWQRNCTFTQIGKLMGYSRHIASRRLKNAEAEVDRQLNQVYLLIARDEVYPVADSTSVSIV